MSIPDFDIEPVVGSRFWAVVLGVVSAAAGTLAVIGWPLPVVSGRGGSDRHAWAQTVRGIEAWSAHEGWRLSGTSWVYGALAVAALAGVIVLLHPAWSGTRRFVLVVVPAGALLGLGPAVQWALGLPWSNYQTGSAGGMALGIVVALGIVAVITGAGRAVRRSARPEDDLNLPPRGFR